MRVLRFRSVKPNLKKNACFVIFDSPLVFEHGSGNFNQYRLPSDTSKHHFFEVSRKVQICLFDISTTGTFFNLNVAISLLFVVIS